MATSTTSQTGIVQTNSEHRQYCKDVEQLKEYIDHTLYILRDFAANLTS